MPPKLNDYTSIGPHLNFLSDPAILVQAWKKAHTYIRSHNWYADSLELDLSTIRLRSLIDEWSSEIISVTKNSFSPDPMRIVPAPKTSEWSTSDGWNPEHPESVQLRPLAHLSIRDQTFAMTVLITLADIVESEQGDPRLPITIANQNKIVSYGHRLITRWENGTAYFQWGNAKLYRQYFEDYQQFVRRPEIIRQELFNDSHNWAIVQIDLSKFYDLIPRDILLEKLESLCNDRIENRHRSHQQFFKTVKSIFDWNWHSSRRVMDMGYRKGLPPVVFLPMPICSILINI